MKAQIYENGEQAGSIETAPFQWNWDGDDERVQSVLKATDQMRDTIATGPDSGPGNASTPRERDAAPSEEMQFQRAVARIRDLGHWVETSG